jgi:hypothetical protein
VCATCTTPANAAPVCNGSACDFACATGYLRSGTSCLWNDPSLSALTLSVGTLNFSPSVTSYAVDVPAGTTLDLLTATVAQPALTSIIVNGTVLAPSGSATPITLKLMAPTTITVQVIALSGATRTYTLVLTRLRHQDFLKASNPDITDRFAQVALSADGTTMVVGAPNESSNATGVNGNQADNSLVASGAAYVFVRGATGWVQQAYLKSSNPDVSDWFGSIVAISADGNTLAVGAYGEDSIASTIDGNQADNSASSAGAVYVFVRTGTTWTQQAYVKPSNMTDGDWFGEALALSSDGNTLAVGSLNEDSAATGINGNGADNTVRSSGAAYVFVRSGTTWSQQAYVKASNTDSFDYFGYSVALSGDGNTLAVGAPDEASNATGLYGSQTDNSAISSGAAYVFGRTTGTWTQRAYVKASNTEANDNFGRLVALSGDGTTLAVAARGEDSAATGVNGTQADNTMTDSGAVYVFKFSVGWNQQAYVKASNPGVQDAFGASLALNTDGSVLAVGAYNEDSDATGIGGSGFSNLALDSGAVYLFTRAASTWSQAAYVKASNTEAADQFGVSVSLSGDGSTLVIGAGGEDSSVAGGQADNSLSNSGAVYVWSF